MRITQPTVMITGSRNWPEDRYDEITAAINELDEGSVLISGGAKGVDTVAEEAARARGLEVRRYLPDWEKYGRRAGIVRNSQMVDLRPSKVLAFWRVGSTGTHHAIRLAQGRGIPTTVVIER